MPKDHRQANTFEFAYEYLAADLKTPEICEKISPRAHLGAMWGGRGYQISYTRSVCYFNLAVKTNDTQYCTNVVELEDLWLDGSKLTEEHCREYVYKRPSLRASGGDPEWLLRFMGFSDSSLGKRDWNDLFIELRPTRMLRERAMLLPDFSRADGTVVVGVSYSEMGCQSECSEMWYCYAYRCLRSGEEEFREACLDVAKYLQTKQRLEASGREFQPSKYVQSLLDHYPELGTFTSP